jgi:hypothetical protein
MTPFDFGALIDELERAKVSRDGLPALWGGEFGSELLAGFLSAWIDRSDLPWRLWEWVSDIQLRHEVGPVPGDLPWLERARLFGDGGDLELRRDGQRILWRFVGPPVSALPSGLRLATDGSSTASTGAVGEGDESSAFVAYPYPYGGLGPDWRCVRRTSLLWGQELLDEHDQGLGVWQEDRVAVRLLRYPDMSGLSQYGRVELVYDEYLQGDAVQAVWWRALQGFTGQEDKDHGGTE